MPRGETAEPLIVILATVAGENRRLTKLAQARFSHAPSHTYTTLDQAKQGIALALSQAGKGTGIPLISQICICLGRQEANGWTGNDASFPQELRRFIITLLGGKTIPIIFYKLDPTGQALVERRHRTRGQGGRIKTRK